MKKKLFLLFTFSLIFILPLLGSLLKWDGLPPGYGDFPSQKVMESPGFSPLYFSAGCAIAVFILLFLIFPRWFGFKKIKPSHIVATDKPPFPQWFWWSLPVLGVSWLLMWLPLSFLSSIRAYTFVPLWWSFIFILDGFVYRRNQGRSLISTKPHMLQLLALVSCLSWFIFEYLNYFVLENWHYPNNEIFSNFGNVFWFSLSYTTVLPAIVEWYLLLQTFSSLHSRYSEGPKLKLPRKAIVIYYILGLFLSFGMGFYPFLLFWVLWVALVPLLSAAMGLTGFWTPFSPITKGNWAPLILIALATVCNGVFWEIWNYGSEAFNQGVASNPNFWQYTVPYMDKIHLFSEMPILGYFGYLFFGVNCWIIWLTAAYLFKFDADFDIVRKK